MAAQHGLINVKRAGACGVSNNRGLPFWVRVQDFVETKKKKGEVPEVPRGMYTSPAKKGSYGFIKTTISERQGPKVSRSGAVGGSSLQR